MVSAEVEFVTYELLADPYLAPRSVNYLDTFKAPEPGYLGGLFNNEPFYYYDAATPKCQSKGTTRVDFRPRRLIDHSPSHFPDKVKFDVTNITSLPKVDIVYGYVYSHLRSYPKPHC